MIVPSGVYHENHPLFFGEWGLEEVRPIKTVKGTDFSRNCKDTFLIGVDKFGRRDIWTTPDYTPEGHELLSKLLASEDIGDIRRGLISCGAHQAFRFLESDVALLLYWHQHDEPGYGYALLYLKMLVMFDMSLEDYYYQWSRKSDRLHLERDPYHDMRPFYFRVLLHCSERSSWRTDSKCSHEISSK